MAISKKDYEGIAGEFRQVRQEFQAEDGPSDLTAALWQIERGIANYMAADNPRFDRARFLAACRGEDATDSAGRTVHYGR